jgi:hypothetical protein
MNETFPVELGGKKWEIPHLPFRVGKRLQPLFAAETSKLFGDANAARAVAMLDERTIDALAGGVYEALHEVDRSLSKEAFYELTFSSGDLVAALPSVLSACGMKIIAKQEGDAPEKK